MTHLKERPRSQEAERAVISAWFLENDLIGESADAGIGTDSFHDPQNRLLATCAMAAYGRGEDVDELAIYECITKSGDDLDLTTILEIAGSLETTVQFARYLEILKDNSDRRKIHDLGLHLVDHAGESEPMTLISDIDRVMLEVAEGDQKDRLHDSSSFDSEGWEHLQRRMESGGQLGITTGLSGIDFKLRGLKPAELILLAARPSVGKTALSLHIFWEAAVEQRVPTLYCSLEMSAAPLATRLWQAKAGISGAIIDDGHLTENQMKAIEGVRTRQRGCDYWVEETPGMSVAQIRMRARRLKPKGLGLIIIDYCQLISARDKRMPREQQVAEISQSLKNLSKELELPVLLLCQLNRQVSEGKPGLSNLRESGQLEQDADAVLMLYREDDESNVVICDVAKNRNGPIGQTKLDFNKPTQAFKQYMEPPKKDLSKLTQQTQRIIA